MKDSRDKAALHWLNANAGPIIRWRLVTDFAIPIPRKEATRLQGSVLASDEVRYWLGNLNGGVTHGSKDTNAENAMAKLVEYGLRAGVPEFDEKMMPYTKRPDRVGYAFLIAAGYSGEPEVANRFSERLDQLHETATRGESDLYLPASETQEAPKPWRGRRIYRPEFTVDSVPSCYDLYAMAHWPSRSRAERQRIEDIVAYISHPDFQDNAGGYFWNRERNVCHAAGRIWIACLTPERLILFLELAARFAPARKSPWFKEALEDLERHRTEKGTYRFPPEYLKEKRNSYYILKGAHMGLGESRRKRDWIEIESTFRMLNIHRLMNLGNRGQVAK